MKLSVVIPCYNEAENIPLILKKFSTAIDKESIEVVMVDNGSTDASADVLQDLLPDYKFATSVKVQENQGYGYGILQGLKVARGEFIGWTHADLQTDPADIVRAYHVLERKGWDKLTYVKGTRRGRSLADRFFTFGMGVYETCYLGRRLYDINAQPNIFHRSFFESWLQPPYDFSLDLYALYLATGTHMHVERIEVDFPPRQHGQSHWNTGIVARWKFIKRTIEFSRELKKKGIH